MKAVAETDGKERAVNMGGTGEPFGTSRRKMRRYLQSDDAHQIFIWEVQERLYGGFAIIESLLEQDPC